MNHLRDDQIQNYLDGNFQKDYNEIENHLEHCSECKQSLIEYREIYNALQLADTPVLSDDFSENTIVKLEQLKEKKWDIFENITIAFLLICGAALIIYFFDMFNFVDHFKAIDFSLLTNFGQKLIGSISSNIFYLALAVIITSIIELVDRFLVKKPYKHAIH